MIRLYILFASVYLLEGITEVSFILNVYLKKVLAFSPSEVGQVLFLGGLWFIILKPLIGFIADFWKRFNTRMVLTLGLIFSFAGWVLIAHAQTTLSMTLGVSLKVIAIALLDVLIDGMIVAVSTDRNRSFIQSLVYGCRFGGSMLCATWAGGRIETGVAAFTQIYWVFSLISLAVLLPVLIYRKRAVEESRELQSHGTDMAGKPLARADLRAGLRQLARPEFGWLLVLLFLFALGVDTSTYFDPILEERFGGEFLGRITSVYYVGILLGVLSFPLLRLRLGMKQLFVLSLFGWSAIELSCIWISSANGALIYFFGGFFNAYSSIALLTVAVAMCKIPGIETFAFAFAISFKNLMDQSKVLFGGYLMEATGITWLFIISSLCGLLPFLVLRKIDFREI
jgi:predicted MFS family arabinose efflux permease